MFTVVLNVHGQYTGVFITLLVAPGNSLLALLLIRFAKLGNRLFLQPAFLALHKADLLVLGAVGEKVDPVLQAAVHSLFGFCQLILFELLHLGRSPLGIDLGIVDREIHCFEAAHIRGQILLEAAANISARCITAGKEVVRATNAVHVQAVRDVEDGTIDGEVQGFALFVAIVLGELLRSKVNWSAL